MCSCATRAGAPILFEGRLYLPTVFSRVLALDPSTGVEVWSSTVTDIRASSLEGVLTGVRFDYSIRPGVSSAPNALRLLARTGYPEAV
ncbi:MAG: hypothetical protein WD766_09325, partial [Gemmatimonadota bacterium]